MAITSSGNWPSIAQKDLSLIFLDQLHGFPSMLPFIYRFKSAEQGTEYDLETGDTGAVPVFNGSISYEQITEGYKKFVQETDYALGFIVTRQLLRNDLYGVIQDKAASLADAFRILRETQGAYPFVNAFSSAFTVGDSLSLCNSAHTSQNGGPNQSNTSTLAFSAANLQANRVAMKKLVSNTGLVQTNIPDMIMAPLDLEDVAYEVLNSMGKVDTANNNRNYSEGRYKLLVWDNFLTSTTNWFLVNQALMKQRLVFREWEPVSFMRIGDFNTLYTAFAGFTAFGVSSVEWRWIYGSSN